MYVCTCMCVAARVQECRCICVETSMWRPQSSLGVRSFGSVYFVVCFLRQDLTPVYLYLKHRSWHETPFLCFQLSHLPSLIPFKC